MPIAINTLEYARLLIDSGVEQKQAEAHALTLDKTLKEHVPSKEELKESLKSELATKEDIRLVKEDIRLVKIELNSKIDSTRWLLGVVISLNLVMLGVMLSQFY